MPLLLWLASFLGSIFSSVVAFFFQYMTRKLAITAAVIAAIGVLTVAFFAAVYSLISGLVVHAPDFIIVAASWVVPDNVPALISISLTARALRWAYEWNIKALQMRLS